MQQNPKQALPAATPQVAPDAPKTPAETVVPSGRSPSAGVHRRLTLNSISNLARYLISVGLGFFLTPYIVRNLGDSLYGFWVLLLSFIGYASMLEMGIQPAVVKLVGQYTAVEDRTKMRELITAAFLFFAAVGLLSALVILFLVPRYVWRFVAAVDSIPHHQWVFAAIAFDAALMFLNYLFTGMLYGWQRYHAKNLIDMAAWLVNAAMVVTFLPKYGLLSVAASKLATDAVSLGATVIVCFRTFPGLRPQSVTRRSFFELMSFGSRVFISATTTRLATNAQPLIISTWISSAATAFYSIPCRLVDYGREIGWALTTGFMPLFSELQSRREGAMLRTIYLNYSRYVLLLTLPLFVLIQVWGVPFIRLWIGADYAERGRTVLPLVAASGTVDALQPLLWRLFIGVGRLRVLVTVSAAASALVVVASILLVKPLGIVGVAVAVLAGSLVSQLAFAIHSCAFLEKRLSSLFAEVHLRPLGVALVGYALARLIALGLGTGSYAVVALGAALAMLVYFAFAALIALTPSERAWLRARLARR
jgi:O-antigen/teichoic acid export membrane protein